MALAGPCPYHGAFAGGKMPSEPRQATEPPASTPQQRLSCSQILPAGLGVSCGHEIVALSPCWGATLHWLQLYYMAVGTAQGERASFCLLPAALEDALSKASRGPGSWRFQRRSCVCSLLVAGSAPSKLSPRTRARESIPGASLPCRGLA